MTIFFNKYHGAGNDFVVIDNRNNVIIPAMYNKFIENICNRRFGIGADGLILICADSDSDFEMKYYNSDGYEGSMCGNGGRCAAAFAYKNNIAGNVVKFRAIDGFHNATIDGKIVTLSINNVSNIKKGDDYYFINTGSPHYVAFMPDIDAIDVNKEGMRIRNSPDFSPDGINVNFVELAQNHIYVRTYERGVEAETLSCGTGATASAIAAVVSGHFDSKKIDVKTKGGNLSVSFDIKNETIKNIFLSGPATFVFEGKIEI